MIHATDFLNEEDYFQAVHEEAMGPMTMGERDRFEAQALGAENTERCWILSDRDVWYRNPSYRGPAMPHPEEN